MSRPESFAGTSAASAGDWIGRRVERNGMLTRDLAGMLGAAVGHERSASQNLKDGAVMPTLWHWAAFPEFVPLSELGSDGHPALGNFLPPLALSRRMWAGGTLTFTGELHIGERLTKTSRILSITDKEGATGPMVFVRVGHVITGEDNGHIEEEQDIVYLDIPESFRAPRKIPSPAAPDFDETVTINEARLFRYSAATFNAHRIHYDLPYTQEVEKYPALVVHGPMQATMVMEAARRHTGCKPHKFSFRGVHPMFHDQDLRLTGQRCADGKSIKLVTAAPSGHQGLQARMEWI